MAGQKYTKRGNKGRTKGRNKGQWLKLFVLTFGVADAAGIYIAHERLNHPAPGSLQDEVALAREGVAVPAVAGIGPAPAVAPAGSNAQLADAHPTLSPELRFTPQQAVPDYRPAEPARVAPAQAVPSLAGKDGQLARIDLPKPQFGKVAQPLAARPDAAAQPNRMAIAPVVPHIMPVKASAMPAAQVNPVLRQSAGLVVAKTVVPVHQADRHSAVTVALSNSAPAHRNHVAHQGAGLGLPHAATAYSGRAADLDASHHATRANFARAFGDLDTGSATGDSALTDTAQADAPALDLPQVASAPSGFDAPGSFGSSSAVDHSPAQSSAPAAELPAVADAGNSSG